MKKITSFVLSGVFGLALLAGCASETANLLPEQSVQNTNNSNGISTFSREGLNSTYKVVLKSFFDKFDTNKNKYVSLAEYKAAYAPQPAPVPSVVPSEEPSVAPSGGDQPDPAPATTPEEIASRAKKVNIPADPAARFAKMDKNKDNNLSFTEVSNNPNFFVVGLDKNTLKSLAQQDFNYLNTDKNKTISRNELLAMAGGNYTMQLQLSTMFYSADRDRNGSLSMSEFEDLIYSSIKASLTTVPNVQPTATPDPVEPSAMPSEAPAPVDPAPSEAPADPAAPTN